MWHHIKISMSYGFNLHKIIPRTDSSPVSYTPLTLPTTLRPFNKLYRGLSEVKTTQKKQTTQKSKDKPWYRVVGGVAKPYWSYGYSGASPSTKRWQGDWGGRGTHHGTGKRESCGTRHGSAWQVYQFQRVHGTATKLHCMICGMLVESVIQSLLCPLLAPESCEVGPRSAFLQRVQAIIDKDVESFGRNEAVETFLESEEHLAKRVALEHCLHDIHEVIKEWKDMIPKGMQAEGGGGAAA